MSSDLKMPMYNGLGDFENALRAFQTDLGDKATGVATVSQIYKLQQRAGAQRLGYVAFPETYHSYITDNYARVEGTVTILDDKIAYPINHTKVTC